MNFDAGTVAIDYTVIRIKGRGLIRKSTKTAAGERTLPLPMWALDMLKARFVGAEGADGPIFPQ